MAFWGHKLNFAKLYLTPVVGVNQACILVLGLDLDGNYVTAMSMQSAINACEDVFMQCGKFDWS